MVPSTSLTHHRRVGRVRVGISGWRYPPWRGTFYPSGLPQRLELSHAASLLDTVEISRSLYSLQSPAAHRNWHAATPADSPFAVKGGRFITHMLKLRGVEQALAPLTEPGPRRRIRHALEVRHHSFASPELPALLRDHDVSLVVADTAGKWPLLEEVTSDLVHVRLHGAEELYVSGYDDAALRAWAAKVRGWAERADVVVHFGNDAKVRAPYGARALRGLLSLR
jgi:uncharacterized protein YecE (DUF72 family)